MRWDYTSDSTYTLLVTRNDSVFLSVDDQPALIKPYEDLEETPSDIGASIFVTGNVIGEYSSIQICACSSSFDDLMIYYGKPVDIRDTLPTLEGPDNKIAIENLTVTPNPFQPPNQQAQLSFDLEAINLPGNNSGQFEYKTNTVWEIATYEPVKLITQEHRIDAEGTLHISILWDGKGDSGADLPTGVYVFRTKTQLIRTKIKNGKTHVFDEVLSPWRFLHIDRDDYFADVSAFVQAGGYEHEGSSTDLIVRRGYNGRIKTVIGDSLSVALRPLDCLGGGPDQETRCVLNLFKDTFGIVDVASQLDLKRQKVLSNGSLLMKYQQTAVGYPVWEGNVTVNMWPGLSVTAVFSSMREPLNPPSPAQIQQALSQFDINAARNTVANYLNFPSVQLVFVDDWLYVDKNDPLALGVPAKSFRVFETGKHHQRAYVLLRAPDGMLLHHSDTTAFAWPDKEIYASARHPAWDTVNTCCLVGTSAGCSTPLGFECDADYESEPMGTTLNSCIKPCVTDGECPTGWGCIQDSTSTMFGYCYDTPPEASNEALAYDGDDTTDSWHHANYTRHLAYQRIKQRLDEYVDWSAHELGVSPADLHPDFKYRVNLLTICNCNDDGDPACALWEGCGPSHQCYRGSNNSKNGICLPAWFWDYLEPRDPTDPDDPFKYDASWPNDSIGNFGHEFGHVILSEYYNYQGPPADTGLTEGLAEIFEYLYVRWMLPTQPWPDHTTGLSHGYYPVPYALRSRVDWFDTNDSNLDEFKLPAGADCSDWTNCPPYYFCRTRPNSQNQDEYWCTTENNAYQNRGMWARFLRLLTEGPEDFLPTNPQIVLPRHEFLFSGQPFTGLGISTTQTIVHEAAYALAPQITQITLQDWADKLIWAGYNNGAGEAVQYALGVHGFYTAGMVGAPYYIEHSPREIVFPAWQLDTDKKFVVWTQPTTGRIKYAYYQGGTLHTRTIPNSQSTSRPAVAVYEDSWGSYLFIFWRAPNSSVYYVAVTPSGVETSPPVSLHGTGIDTNGAFEAVVFESRLYLVFGHESNNKLSVAYCPNTIGCIAGSAWHSFSPGVYHQELAFAATINHGPSAIVASSVNGSLSPGPDLYIAYSERSINRIRVIRLDSLHNVLETHSMPSGFPYQSENTTAPIGLTVRQSAFPYVIAQGIASPRNYLYLTWTGDSTKRVYTSVLQNVSLSETWFTRPLNTFLQAKQGTGSSWRVDPSMTSSNEFALVYAGHYGSGWVPRRAYTFGRY